MSLSRRELFAWFRPAATLPAAAPAVTPPVAPPPRPGFALPARLMPEVVPAACLATTSFCTVCSERCPQPGAIVLAAGRPRIVAERCDGCGRCVGACPAPTLALALVPRPGAAEAR